MPPTPQRKARFLTDPVEFQTHQLNRRLWQKQRDILRSVYERPLTAVKGCHASGKTYAVSGLPLSWLVRFQRSKAFITAPTERQVKSFWKDVDVAHSGGPVKQLLPKPTTMALTVGPERYAFGASSSAGVNIQGLHSPNVLIIADEAPGIESDIWDAIEGIRSGGNVHMVELGNPVIPSGHFYDSFTVNRSIYNCISISAFDTPNLQDELTGQPLTVEDLLEMDETRLKFAPSPSLITRAWVRERLKVWGPKHPKYLARVLGEFPGDDPNSVFPLGWIERARREPAEMELRDAARIGKVQVGIDVAGAGADETVLTARIGGIILEQEAWPDADPRGAVCAKLARIRDGKYPLATVVIDTIGIGYNFALHVADQGFPVYGFNAGARPRDTTQFVNQKAEAYWTLRSYLQENLVSGLNDEETAAQLSTLRYRENGRGLTEIESKEARNKRGIPGSPDRAESLIMAFMKVQAAEVTHAFGGEGSYIISAI